MRLTLSIWSLAIARWSNSTQLEIHVSSLAGSFWEWLVSMSCHKSSMCCKEKWVWSDRDLARLVNLNVMHRNSARVQTPSQASPDCGRSMARTGQRSAKWSRWISFTRATFPFHWTLRSSCELCLRSSASFPTLCSHRRVPALNQPRR